MHIVLIEPDIILADIYIQAFQRQGHTVRHCRGAETAIVAADTKRPDGVVMELQLATHSGAAFLYEFRSYQDWASIPIVVHTVIPPDQLSAFEQTFHELGVSKVLYKPQTTLRKLIQCVQEQMAPVP